MHTAYGLQPLDHYLSWLSRLPDEPIDPTLDIGWLASRLFLTCFTDGPAKEHGPDEHVPSAHLEHEARSRTLDACVIIGITPGGIVVSAKLPGTTKVPTNPDSLAGQLTVSDVAWKRKVQRHSQWIADQVVRQLRL